MLVSSTMPRSDLTVFKVFLNSPTASPVAFASAACPCCVRVASMDGWFVPVWDAVFINYSHVSNHLSVFSFSHLPFDHHRQSSNTTMPTARTTPATALSGIIQIKCRILIICRFSHDSFTKTILEPSSVLLTPRFQHNVCSKQLLHSLYEQEFVCYHIQVL